MEGYSPANKWSYILSRLCDHRDNKCIQTKTKSLQSYLQLCETVLSDSRCFVLKANISMLEMSQTVNYRKIRKYRQSAGFLQVPSHSSSGS